MKESYFNEEDIIRLSVPVFLRITEYARESANLTDDDLHFMTERLVELCKHGHTVTMNNFSGIIPHDKMPV